jgi:Lrp/AsnC family transcriptional regulator for asnA, asnC and gidA
MKSDETPPLDELDLAILSHLERDGRKSFSDIAAELDVTVSTVSTRANRLINDKVVTILGFLNPLREGMILSATLFITCQPGQIELVAELLSDFPEVSYLALFTGDFDLFVEVGCRDFDHLSELLTQRIHTIKGIEKVRSSLHLRRLKLKQPSLKLLTAGSAEEE